MTQSLNHHLKASTTTPRILVIEDDANQRYIFRRALSHAGYQVYPAATLDEAHNLLTNNRFDVLLCDVRMDGGRYGTELIQAHATQLNERDTQIIMTSGEASYRHMCESLGLNLFVKKPIGVRPLVELVSNLTARH